jgi:aminoglycoside/choline kinase family phosphotransferase
MQDDFSEQACRLLDELDESGDDWRRDRVRIEALTPDGSLRRFCRIFHKDGRSVVAVAPPVGDPVGLREAVSGWHIGRHLFALGAPVPELYAFDEQSGLLVCEDLGDRRLHDLILENGVDSERVMRLYHQTVIELAKMQVRGRKGFEASWCWDTPRYDRRLMLERESGYFLQALCRDFLQINIDQQKIEQEFSVLADRAATADASFFLHRDFQSRNIMVRQGRVRFIDYQAGRSGPLAYDLPSLLIDPYAALPRQSQDDLLERYLDALTALIPYDRRQFQREYVSLALQRNMQILGAFAFLSKQRDKPFFRQYIKPALRSLQTLLAKVIYKT